MKEGDSPVILHTQSRAGSVAAAAFGLLGAAWARVHRAGRQHCRRAAKGWGRSAQSICNAGFGIAALVTNGQVQQPVGPGCRPSFKNQTSISISTSKIKPTY